MLLHIHFNFNFFLQKQNGSVIYLLGIYFLKEFYKYMTNSVK